MTAPVLQVDDLEVAFRTEGGTVHAVNGVSFEVRRGEVLAIVGESGSGKSVTAMTMMGLTRSPNAEISGSAKLGDTELIGAPDDELRAIRGNRMAMIFQDPMSSLNPVYRVGDQITEQIQAHTDMSDDEAFTRVVELLGEVGIPGAEERARAYPHEFSGGMRQRAMIAMGISLDPELLIADEPTTALDVTIQAQILELLRTAQKETGSATILITHDLGVVAELADRVVVMYAGRVVEEGGVTAIFSSPRHPYTAGLLDSRPLVDGPPGELTAIPGAPPSLLAPPSGCPFHPRCALSQGRERCRTQRPPLREVEPGQVSACHFAEELAP
jgi:oligopeptide/dipeptide ABC transporter ATP-binding protein